VLRGGDRDVGCGSTEVFAEGFDLFERPVLQRVDVNAQTAEGQDVEGGCGVCHGG
jgi:hypothetical protein